MSGVVVATSPARASTEGRSPSGTNLFFSLLPCIAHAPLATGQKCYNNEEGRTTSILIAIDENYIP